MSIDLAVIVPTFSERENVDQLVARIAQTLHGLEWEIIFVDDDSPDGTAAAVWETARENPRVRCLQRVHRRGLASAAIEGMLSTAAPVLAVMDADFQHDERMLPTMYETLLDGDFELVIASRYVDGASTGIWSSERLWMSRFASYLGRIVMPLDVRDPMSGFFMLRRSLLHEVVHELSGKGFKLLLDICSTARRPLEYQEVPYSFGERRSGESKLDSMAVLEYGYLLADKTIGRVVPVRFVLFVGVGLLGALFHMAVLAAGMLLLRFPFLIAQLIATYVAMTANFLLNNRLTYRSHQLRGREFVKGLVSFCLVCTFGAVINVSIAQFLYSSGTFWLVAGVIGGVVGGVWNFAISSTVTWHLGESR